MSGRAEKVANQSAMGVEALRAPEGGAGSGLRRAGPGRGSGGRGRVREHGSSE